MNHLKDIIQQAKHNEFFRHVLATGKHSQIVIMSIPAGEDIGEETHNENDQTIYLAEGAGQAVIDGEAKDFTAGDMVLVSAGTPHNFISSGAGAMKIITIYAPAHHAEGTIHKTKAEAVQDQ